MQLSRPSALLTFGPTAFVATFASFMATILNVNASLVAVSDYVLTPGSVLSPSSTRVGMQVDFVVQPPDSFSTQQASLLQTRCGLRCMMQRRPLVSM